MGNLTVKRFKGKQILDYIEQLAALRMKVFREYPYLYEGNYEYEMKYLNTYATSEEAILVVAQDNDKIIGLSTAIPLQFEMPETQKPFLDLHLPIEQFFYLGESVLLPEYRGSGIYRQYFQEREAAALSFGCKITTFCGVVRDEHDSRRPRDYVPLDNIWRHFGYEKHPELCSYYEWQEIGASQRTQKPMIYWIKNL